MRRIKNIELGIKEEKRVQIVLSLRSLKLLRGKEREESGWIPAFAGMTEEERRREF